VIERARRATRAVNRVFIALAGAMALGIFAVILYDVLMRNAFDAPTVWALDVSRFLLVYLFFLALAPALEAGTHVSVDAVMHWVSPAAARRLRMAAVLLTMVFGMILLWQVTRATLDAFARDEMFPTAVPIRMKYVFWIGPLGTLQFVLTAVVALAALWIPSSDSRSS
jgi:TRAP-type C4-dicarboxylate transport system permease small subunit